MSDVISDFMSNVISNVMSDVMSDVMPNFMSNFFVQFHVNFISDVKLSLYIYMVQPSSVKPKTGTLGTCIM